MAVKSEQVVVPREFVDEGKIVLNVSPLAVRNLVLGNETCTFDGRFSGKPFVVSVPVASVLTIYAKETGEGLMFDEGLMFKEGLISKRDMKSQSEIDRETDESEPPDPPGGASRPGAHLKIVK